MARDLSGKRIAILAADGVERIELEQPRGALYGAGAVIDLLSLHRGEIQARQFDMIPAGTIPVDWVVSERRPTTTTRCCCPAAPSTRTSCGSSQRGRHRQGVRRDRQAHRGDLPRPVDAGHCGRSPRRHAHLVA